MILKEEDLSLIAQLIESMQEISKELEKAMKKRDVEKIKLAKGEILKFQRQISKLLG